MKAKSNYVLVFFAVAWSLINFYYFDQRFWAHWFLFFAIFELVIFATQNKAFGTGKK